MEQQQQKAEQQQQKPEQEQPSKQSLQQEQPQKYLLLSFPTIGKVHTSLTPAEKTAVNVVFDTCAILPDGSLSVHELRKQFKISIKKIQEKAPSKPDGKETDEKEEKDDYITEQVAEGIATDLDKTGAGKLSWDQFSKTIEDRLLNQKETESTNEMYQIFDIHGTGFLSAAEFRALMTSTGKNPLTDDEVDKILYIFDHYGDGIINYRQFIAWLMEGETQE